MLNQGTHLYQPMYFKQHHFSHYMEFNRNCLLKPIPLSNADAWCDYERRLSVFNSDYIIICHSLILQYRNSKSKLSLDQQLFLLSVWYYTVNWLFIPPFLRDAKLRDGIKEVPTHSPISTTIFGVEYLSKLTLDPVSGVVVVVHSTISVPPWSVVIVLPATAIDVVLSPRHRPPTTGLKRNNNGMALQHQFCIRRPRME